MTIALFYLVINFGGQFNNGAVTLPMQSVDACLKAAHKLSSKWEIKQAYCINTTTGEANTP